MNILIREIFYGDSTDKETEDIDAEITYVDPAEGAHQIRLLLLTISLILTFLRWSSYLGL